ncbi:MAG: FAD-dependent monooxygenase [Rickettsia sp.]|nr:FAD-dependent monooxygenase [Rickettsia sp.]
MSKILILGDGIFSLLCAIAFSKLGYFVFIVKEKKNCHSLKQSSRTLALTPATKDFLSKLEIWDEISEYVSYIKDIYVIDNMSNNMISFDCKLSKKDQIGFVIQNQDLYNILISRVIANNKIKIVEAENIRIEDSESEMTKIFIDEKEEIFVKLVLINISNNSQIHKRYFIEHKTIDYKQIALTFLVKHENCHEGTAVEHFFSTGPFAILPLKDPNVSSVIWSVDLEYAKSLKSLEINILKQIVQTKFGDFLGKIDIISDMESFHLKGYLCKNYFNGNLLAFGSGLHLIHPLAGQGLNLSIKDLEVLYGIVSSEEISKEKIADFCSQRYQDNLDMFIIINWINKIFSNNSKILYLIRQLGFKIINKSSFLKNKIVNYAMGYR